MNFEEIRQKHNLSLILMHGSQVTGKTHSKSDFDMLWLEITKKKDLTSSSLSLI